MRKALISLILCFFMATGVSFAAQTDAPAGAGHDSHTGQCPSKSASPSGSAQPQAVDHDMVKHNQMMQEHIQKMQAEMEKIKAAADPRERQKLMHAHMASMLDGIKMTKSMPGCKMMSGCKMMPGEKMGAQGHGMMEKENMMPCHQMMGKKMEMMQSVMENLIECFQMSK